MEELYVKFIIMKLTVYERERTVWDRIWINFNKSKYYEKLYKRLPYKETGIYVMGIYGVEVELPFSGYEIADMEDGYLEQYIRKILDIYDIPECYLKRELGCMKGRFGREKKWIFSYLFFQQGMELFMKKYGISKREAKVVIIDSGDKKIEMILEPILQYANYLTIMTERKDYFEKAVNIIYEEIGLMIDVVSSKDKGKITGNFIVNLNRESYQLYADISDNSYIMDLAFTNEKLEYLSNRKKGIELLYGYEILAGNTSLDQELMAEVLVRDNWKLSRFAKRKESILSLEEVETILCNYQLKIDALKTLSL